MKEGGRHNDALSILVMNRTRQRLPLARFRSALVRAVRVLKVRNGAVNAVFVDRRTMVRLFTQHPPARPRHHAFDTNALSFCYQYAPGMVVGDIVLCVPAAIAEAPHFQKTPYQHLAVLLVHGMVHLAGYRHRSDKEAKRMEAVERRIVRQLRQ